MIFFSIKVLKKCCKTASLTSDLCVDQYRVASYTVCRRFIHSHKHQNTTLSPGKYTNTVVRVCSHYSGLHPQKHISRTKDPPEIIHIQTPPVFICFHIQQLNISIIGARNSGKNNAAENSQSRTPGS